MSREGEQPIPAFATHHGSDSSLTNAGFDGPLTTGDPVGTSDSFSHGGHLKTDWPKEVNKMYDHYLSGCPGAYGATTQSTSTGHSAEQWNPLMNVCGLIDSNYTCRQLFLNRTFSGC